MALVITAQARQQLLSTPGVQGFGRGLRMRQGLVTDEEAIVVAVAQKRPLAEIPADERIPPVLEGEPTDVFQVTFEAQLLQQGSPVGPEGKRQQGTLGLILHSDHGGWGLTNEHVLYRAGHSVIGAGVCSPGDGNSRVGQVTHLLDPHTGMGDAVLFRLEPRGPMNTRGLTVSTGTAGGGRRSQRQLSAPGYGMGVIGKPGITVRGLAEANLGDEVWKAGVVTGLTAGQVIAEDVTMRVDYLMRGWLVLHGQVIVRRPSRIKALCLPGDSGAVWCRGDLAVALHLGGDRLGSYAIGTPLGIVFKHILGQDWQAWLAAVHLTT